MGKVVAVELYCRTFVSKAKELSEFVNGLRLSNSNKHRILKPGGFGSYIEIRDYSLIYTSEVFVLMVQSRTHGPLFAMYKDVYFHLMGADYSRDDRATEKLKGRVAALAKDYGVSLKPNPSVKTWLLIYSALQRIREYERQMSFKIDGQLISHDLPDDATSRGVIHSDLPTMGYDTKSRGRFVKIWKPDEQGVYHVFYDGPETTAPNTIVSSTENGPP